MKRLFLISASVVLMCAVLCSCGNADESTEAETQATEKKKEKPTEAPTESATEEVITIYTDPEDEEEVLPYDDVPQNWNSDEEITDFEYMTLEKGPDWEFDVSDYDGILTCYIKNDLNPDKQTMHYLVDLKMGKIYFSSNPGDCYSVDDYSDEKELDDQDIAEIKTAIRGAEVQTWKDEETGDNPNCGDVSIIALEYSTGEIERHSVVCLECGGLKEFKTVVNKISQITDNDPVEDPSDSDQESATESADGVEGADGADGVYEEPHYHEDYTTIYVYEYEPGDENMDGYGRIEGCIDGYGYLDGYGFVEEY
ncbi:MAG: hypothetical protein UD936_03460 [Acutalibacteraceae bacterium]|nr:hypothetical protein [Acutalibacteraceae bacterium]